MKKNLLKSTLAVAVLASSIASFSPIAYGKTTSFDLNQVKSELNKATTQYVNPALTGVLVPSSSLYDTLNSAKKNYQVARNAIVSSNLSAKEKESKLNELDALYNEKISKGLVSYIDAYNYATKYLEPAMREMKEAEAKNDFAGVAKRYHELSYQLKDRTAILYRFSGKAARDLLFEQYKKPADALRDELAIPVTIYMKLVELNNLYVAGKKEEALKAYAELEALLKTLPTTNKYAPTLVQEVEKIKAIMNTAPTTSTDQQVLDKKLATLIEGLNATQSKHITVSTPASNSLVVAIKEDVNILEFIGQGFYTSLVTGLGVKKINGNDPASEAAMNDLKKAFSAEAKTLADLKGKTITLPLTVNTGSASELNVNFTITFE